MSVILMAYDLLVTKPIGIAQKLFSVDACISCVFIASFFSLFFYLFVHLFILLSFISNCKTHISLTLHFSLLQYQILLYLYLSYIFKVRYTTNSSYLYIHV